MLNGGILLLTCLHLLRDTHIDEAGQILPEVADARRRGILSNVGNGREGATCDGTLLNTSCELLLPDTPLDRLDSRKGDRSGHPFSIMSCRILMLGIVAGSDRGLHNLTNPLRAFSVSGTGAHSTRVPLLISQYFEVRRKFRVCL